MLAMSHPRKLVSVLYKKRKFADKNQAFQKLKSTLRGSWPIQILYKHVWDIKRDNCCLYLFEVIFGSDSKVDAREYDEGRGKKPEFCGYQNGEDYMWTAQCIDTHQYVLE